MTTKGPARPRSSHARPAARDDQQIGGRPSSPSLRGDDHRTESPDTPHQPTPSSSQGRAPWHYPDPHHPATQQSPRVSHIRTTPCPHCGAPSNAQCVTKTGSLYDGVHKDRVRAWGGSR